MADILRRDDTDRGYDTTAEVKRIEDGTAWVHFPGGEDETPVRMTVNANVGDNVQVRVSGGRAFIIGNGTAPPTDDGKAKELHAISSKAIGVVKGVADKAFKIAGNTAQYFWTTEEGTDTGAHITEIPKESFEADPDHGGANLLLRSIGIAIRQGLVELASFSVAGMHVNTYDSQGNEVTIAHLGYGEGASQSGTATAPYYTLGTRKANTTVGNYSTAAGYDCIASGGYSFAEGKETKCYGHYSHTEGYEAEVQANMIASHASGRGTIAYCDYQTVISAFNRTDGGTLRFIIGNGTSDNARSNAFSVDWHGNVKSYGGSYFIDISSKAEVAHFRMKNSQHDGGPYISATGELGIYSHTQSKWIIYMDKNGKVYIPQTIYGGTALGTGGKTAWNDTAHDGAWLSSTGEIHLTEQSASRGGTVSFHFNRSASATTSLYEGTSGVLTNTGRLVTSDWSGTGRTPVSSATTDGGRISYLQATAASLRVAGQWGTAGGSYTITDFLPPTSDVRLKKNVEDCEVEDALSVINRIRMRSFDWLHTDEHQKIGFIADELEKIDPKLSVGGGTERDGTIHYKSVDTFYMMGYLVKAVQELSAQNAKLTAELNALKEVVK